MSFAIAPSRSACWFNLWNERTRPIKQTCAPKPRLPIGQQTTINPHLPSPKTRSINYSPSNKLTSSIRDMLIESNKTVIGEIRGDSFFWRVATHGSLQMEPLLVGSGVTFWHMQSVDRHWIVRLADDVWWLAVAILEYFDYYQSPAVFKIIVIT